MFSNLQKRGPNRNPEHFLFRWIVLRVIWHLFKEIWAKVKNFLSLSHLYKRLDFEGIWLYFLVSSVLSTQECGGQQPPPRPGRGRCPDWWQEIQCCQGAIKTEMDSKVYPFFVLHGGRLRHWEESFHILLPQPLTTSGEATFAIKVIKPKSQYLFYLPIINIESNDSTEKIVITFIAKMASPEVASGVVGDYGNFSLIDVIICHEERKMGKLWYSF